jgi:hypothetical protein
MSSELHEVKGAIGFEGVFGDVTRVCISSLHKREGPLNGLRLNIPKERKHHQHHVSIPNPVKSSVGECPTEVDPTATFEL